MNKIIKGDQVVVISGKDKGKKGQVLKVIGDKVIVDGVSLVKRHQKPNPLRGVEGGVIVKSMPIHIAKVALLNKETQKADRVTIKIVETGGQVKRVRVFKSTGSDVA
ncbi:MULTISPECIES: 50S ribosomal protein L24 [Eikenella]|uniref:Large ribosomal subunit protein uL24 n=1 Tax=Eikenella longinqua TaxID=1795827 RepID=A0A1A9RTD2_9NEIS|nr:MULTISPECIES: 50S ribosomal protein L24 [Eikenella]OAM26024.1 50S ribosomal protein L24 [Eikenella longinqua]